MAVKALVFDAYGTLFDVHSVVTRCQQIWPGKGLALSQLWRVKQLEYTWLRSLMGRYENFEAVTRAALRYACAALGLELDDRHVTQLMQDYRELATFPETTEALRDLGGYRLAILSNGSPEMLSSVVAHARLDTVLEAVISVDSLRVYKPDARVYQLAIDRLGVPVAEVGFVSSNCFDACGAKAFGFRTFWINRTGAPVDELGASPDHIVQTLAELAEVVR